MDQIGHVLVITEEKKFAWLILFEVNSSRY